MQREGKKKYYSPFLMGRLRFLKTTDKTINGCPAEQLCAKSIAVHSV
jgi:hypothetical protein